MKKSIFNKRIVAILGCTLMISIFGAGCGSANVIAQNSYEQALIGKWAYIHDTKTPVAEFADDGDVKFEKNKYSFSADGSYIEMSAAGAKESKKLRYVQNGDKMYLYIQSTYENEGTVIPGSVVGCWKSPEGWTFEFTDKGTFMEDGAMTGYYFLDEENGTIKLAYGEALEDTVLYYQLTDQGLFIEYPWLMTRM